MNVELSDAQEQALVKVADLLSEHFDSSLIIVSTELEVDGQTVDCEQMGWNGGYINAIGLAEYALHRLLNDSEHKGTTNSI